MEDSGKENLTSKEEESKKENNRLKWIEIIHPMDVT